ncbi:MAG TPA: hypothetical protein VII13_15670 [Vicinamibacteria bacterium]|jgi:hypothetical protein
MRLVLAFGLALAGVPAMAAPPSVSQSGGLVDVTATATPVSEVLDRLARETGMKLVYEGPHPRTLVSVTVTAATPAQAVFRVLEGLGVGYATRLDPTGTKVESLLVVGSSGGPPRATGAPPPAMRTFEEKPPPPDDEEEVVEDVEGNEEEPAETFVPDKEAPAMPAPVMPAPGGALTPLTPGAGLSGPGFNTFPGSPFAASPAGPVELHVPQSPAEKPAPEEPKR